MHSNWQSQGFRNVIPIICFVAHLHLEPGRQWGASIFVTDHWGSQPSTLFWAALLNFTCRLWLLPCEVPVSLWRVNFSLLFSISNFWELKGQVPDDLLETTKRDQSQWRDTILRATKLQPVSCFEPEASWVKHEEDEHQKGSTFSSIWGTYSRLISSWLYGRWGHWLVFHFALAPFGALIALSNVYCRLYHAVTLGLLGTYVKRIFNDRSYWWKRTRRWSYDWLWSSSMTNCVDIRRGSRITNFESNWEFLIWIFKSQSTNQCMDPMALARNCLIYPSLRRKIANWSELQASLMIIWPAATQLRTGYDVSRDRDHDIDNNLLLDACI